MPVTIENALNDGLDFHITPDGQGRKVTKKVVIDEFPDDPESGQPLTRVCIAARDLGLPFVESVQVDGEGAAWDDSSASVVIDQTGEWTITAYGPPEFRNRNRD